MENTRSATCENACVWATPPQLQLPPAGTFRNVVTHLKESQPHVTLRERTGRDSAASSRRYPEKRRLAMAIPLLALLATANGCDGVATRPSGDEVTSDGTGMLQWSLASVRDASEQGEDHSVREKFVRLWTAPCSKQLNQFTEWRAYFRKQ
ncbi:unnamed protein product [Phytophthora lilii]|uniref:Unnamed protein product n=1 Tax=Phytophthora lilii TaxID=2077276 RepID=A0A9W6TQ92_9STRA|nr:unnamed protein product [Phytophthora lilii]